ncbi:MAG: ribonuclease P protein component [Robiginitomaculum sp.]|nr:ribonuclease P protein component [Robiginitomaculum sp.]
MTIKNIKLGKLKKRSEFLYVRDGRYQAKPNIVIQMRAQSEATEMINVGFTATKKIGNAVVRNRCKRRLRELARALLPLHGKPGHNYVFIARANTAKAEWADLQKDVEKALLRLA